MTLTDRQQEIRRTRVTATDAAAILGQHPYRSAIDVWLSKRGECAEAGDMTRAHWGTILEAPIRADYADRHQLAVAVPGTLIHPTEDWAAATPDGVCYPGGTYVAHAGSYSTGPSSTAPLRGLEVKTHSTWARSYGEPGSDQVPPEELIQCAWNLWVARARYGADLQEWDLVAFVDGLPIDYVVRRDPELEELMVEACRAFHAECILGGRQPEPDGSEAYARHLARLHPRHVGEKLVAADYETTDLVRALYESRQLLAASHREEERLQQQIKRAIGAAPGLEFSTIGAGRRRTERITWRRSADYDRTDYRAVVDALRLAHPEEIEQAIRAHTAIVEGTRRFVVPRSWK